MTILHSITTVAGHNKEAAKKALNQPVVFTHIALGDDDRYPTGGETELGNEVHRGAITGKGTVPGVPNATFFDITVPDDVATFFAREIGLIDEDGVLYALSRYDAPIPKFGPDSANQSAFTFRIIVIFSATANIIIEVDPGWKHTIDAQLRPDFRSVEAIQNDPPVAPVAGQTWIVGPAPTGAWGGHENELAEWSATGWSFMPPTPWMHVGLADRTDWRWDHTLGVPAWIEWKATETLRGPIELATNTETDAGASTEHGITPANLKSRLSKVLGSENLLINPLFRINQDVFAGGAVAASSYAIDMWGAPTASNMSFAGGVATIVSGFMKQVVENPGSALGLITLSWEGTALAGINGSAPAASPITYNHAVAGNISVQFGPGTVTKPVLNVGGDPIPFQAPSYAADLLACLRFYFVRGTAGANIDYYVPTNLSVLIANALRFEAAYPTRMRTVPTITIISHGLVDRAAGPLTTFVTDTSVNFRTDVGPGSGIAGISNLQFKADCRLSL